MHPMAWDYPGVEVQVNAFIHSCTLWTKSIGYCMLHDLSDEW